MKKNYILFSTLIFAGSFTFAQDLGQKFKSQQAIQEVEMESANQQNSQLYSPKSKTKVNKAPGDTLYYEDFSTGGPGGGQLPAGWTRNNNAGNSNDWLWSTMGPGGQYTSVGPLADTIEATGAPTSALNGFMMLPGDLYNTPTPGGGFIDMDASFQSPAITISNPRASVLLQFTHALRWNGTAAEAATVEVSTDGITWSAPYDCKNGHAVNIGSDNAEIVTINVSADLAFANTAYIRFKQSATSHYYWMIDDVLLLEGNANNMILEDYAMVFSDTFDYNPHFTMVPNCIMTSPFSFDAATFNSGGNTQTNVYARADVSQDSTAGGTVGVGSIWTDSTLVGVSVPSGQRDTVNVGGFNAASLATGGKYTATVDVVSDSVNQAPATAIGTYEFSVTDTVLARDRGIFTGSIGVGNYVGGGNQGDRMASMFTVGSTGDTLTSISIFVSTNTLNNGVEIVPKVWTWEQDSATIGGALSTVVAENLVPTTIDPSMYGTWITLDFRFGTGPVELIAGKQYAMGWEQVNGGGTEFSAGRDIGITPFVPDVTNFIYIAGATNTWYWVSSTPGVRANFGSASCRVVGVDEAKIEAKAGFSVAPNPSNGNFTLEVNSNTAKDYNLSIKNTLGQSVYNDVINVNGQYRENLNFENLEKGLYFVTLRNGDERLVKKVVLK